MKNFVVILVAVLSFAVSLLAKSFAEEITWEEISGGRVNLKAVLVHSGNPKIIYAGLKGSVLKTENGGDTWRPVLSVKGQNNDVNLLIFGTKNNDTLFAATAGGLYYSDNQGRNWNRIYRGKNYLENECTGLSVISSSIYLGTKGGLFISNDKGRSWHRVSGEAGSVPTVSISSDIREPGCIYVSGEKSVFRTKDSGKSWEKVFSTGNLSGYNGEKPEETEEEVEKENDGRIRYICQDVNNPNHIYLATSKGVYESHDKGLSWQPISNYGLLNEDVRSLLMSQRGVLYAVTKSGIFEHKGERWHELSSRLVSQKIRFAYFDNQGYFYVACDNGLFRDSSPFIPKAEAQNIITDIYYKDEPEIVDVQNAAIRYAEADPEKIMRWRKQAAIRAFLPKVSAGINRDTSDIWHWESGSTTRRGDDILVRGSDTIGWDVTLTWDLGDLIWNDAQTSIDVRSKLMVELRDNVLDEVTKLYFERLRVKMELDSLSIEDRKRRLEKELRLRELAAYLDALTGNYFSKQLKK